MNAETMFAGTQFVGMALSFTLLLRARQLSVGLWSAAPSDQRLPIGNYVEQLAGIERIFRALERQA
jgi:hypothetical protein